MASVNGALLTWHTNFFQVVCNHSSGLDDGRERKDEINANHMGMCRFSGHTDPEYCKVRNALQRFQKSAETRRKQRLAEQSMCFNHGCYILNRSSDLSIVIQVV